MKKNTKLTFKDVVELITEERSRQKELKHGGDTENFDKALLANDFIALSLSYLGRASQKSFRNQREEQSFDENIIKAIAVLCACLENKETALVL